MGKGDYFGELALLNDSKRSATVTAVGDVKLVSISREALVEVLGNDLEDVLYRNTQRMALSKSYVIDSLLIDQRESILNLLKTTKYSPGEAVITRGTPKGEDLWLVTKGSIRGPLGKIDALAVIGDDYLLSNEVDLYPVDYIAEIDTIVAHITRNEIEECIGASLIEIQDLNEIINILKSVQLLRTLSREKFRTLINMVKEVEYDNGQIIVEQNSPGDLFFIVKSGKVEVKRDGNNIRTVSKHDYFGERSVLFKDFNRSASVIANGYVECWMLERNDFLNIIDEEIRVQLIKRIELQDDIIILTDLLPVKLLGRGNFGSVYLTAHKKKKTLYALKSVLKKKIQAHEMYENIVLERNIMNQLDHSMIVKLVKTFKDDERVYFLMEYVRGNDLFDVLRILDLVKDTDSKFYAACLVLILEYLHEREIAYRDLKPENIMIDEDGYPKLIDFGTAKIISGRTYTVLGTPHYMAPEIILGKGYNSLVDL